MHPYYKNNESYYHFWFIEFIKSRINRLINIKKKNDPGCRAKTGDFYPIKVKLANPCGVSSEEAFSDDFWGWRKCKESLIDIKKLSDEKGFDLLLVILPDFAEDLIDYPLLKMNEIVRKTAEDMGIKVTDFYKYVKGKKNSELQNLEFKDEHPNKLGYRIIAESLFLELKELTKVKDDLKRFRSSKLN